MRRSKFSLSHHKLATFDMGELVPIGLIEVLPGDTIQQATSALVRVSPLNSPVMHPVDVRIHHWFVPHRLVWDDWENFITGGPDGLNASVFPTITVNSGSGFAVGSLADYLGVPTGVDDLPVSALPFRGYQLIWKEWYRDQQLQTAPVIDTTDGADTTTTTSLQNVCWEKDYFTSARPTALLGTEVTLPLGTSAPVKTTSNASIIFNNASGPTGTSQIEYNSATGQVDTTGRTGTWNNGDNLGLGADSNVYADLSNASAATINELRYNMALQRYQEARNRYGARYTEYLRYLGIRSSDARLQRPEYLGGGKQVVQFSEVVQTGVTTSGNAAGPGNLKGHGISALRSNRYRRFFEEHGYIFTLMSVRPKTIYERGLPKHFSRTTKEDFFQKELQHVGQEEVYNKEVYWAHATPNGVFGYQDRYDTYRRQESGVSGEFRGSTMNVWHYARIFTSDPTLNSSFVSCVPTKRVNADTSGDCLWVMANHSVQARRLLDKVGNSFIY